MSDSTDDWKKQMEEASKKAVEDANAATSSELAKINERADDLRAISQKLKLSDPITYDKLVAIVDEATRRNEAISEVVTRVKALGPAAVKLAARIESLTPGAALSTLSKALK